MSQLEHQLIQVLGGDDYLTLVERFGGQVLYVPKQAERAVLSREIGERAARRLAEVYGGEHLTVPLSKTFRAWQYRARGMTMAEISRKLTISESGLYRMFRESRNRGVRAIQFDLFKDET